MFPLSRLLEAFVRVGALTVLDADGRKHTFGGRLPGPAVTLQLADRRLYRQLYLNPELAAGEAYMDGTLTFPGSSLADFLALYNANSPALDEMALHATLERVGRSLRRLQQRNPVGRAQQNVAHHYDLGNAFFRLFLDEGLFYSCAYFRSPNETLEQAQVNKCRLIAAKLDLRPGHEVLDIGSGWGGLACYLARMFDVRVTGVTLSREQQALATERAREAGLGHRVHFKLEDYRLLGRRFDRIVSVGMFEHVGVPRYREFFGKIGDLLADDGIMLLHSIGHMSPPGTTNPWIRKYIFPGAYSPALSEVFPAVEQSRLWVTDCEFLRLHYATTLDHWHRRFAANRVDIAAMYDERFCRMWEFYLLSCAEMFRSGAQEVFQMQLTRRRDAAPLARDYMVDRQREIERRERQVTVPWLAGGEQTALSQPPPLDGPRPDYAADRRRAHPGAPSPGSA